MKVVKTMTKKEFSRIIVKEIEAAKLIIEQSQKEIPYYSAMHGENSPLVIEAKKRFNLALSRMKSLKSLILAPIYERIQNLTQEEIEAYKMEKREEITIKINAIDIDILKLEKEISDINKEKQKLMSLYFDEPKNDYIIKGRELENREKQILENIDKLNEQKSELEDEAIRIINLSSKEFKEFLIQKFGLDSLKEKYEKIKTDNIDKIVAYMIDNPEYASRLVELIKKYDEISRDQYVAVINVKDVFMKENSEDTSYSDKYKWLIKTLFQQEVDDDNCVSFESGEKIDENLTALEALKEKLTEVLENLKVLDATVKFFDKESLQMLNVIINDSYKRNFDDIQYQIQKLEIKKEHVKKLKNKRFKSKKINEEIIIEENEIEQIEHEVISKLWEGLCRKVYKFINSIYLSNEKKEMILENDWDGYSHFKENISQSELMQVIDELILNINVVLTMIDAFKIELDNRKRSIKNFNDNKQSLLRNLEKQITSRVQSVVPDCKIDAEILSTILHTYYVVPELTKADVDSEKVIKEVKEEAKKQNDITIDELEEMKKVLEDILNSLDDDKYSEYTV